MNGPITDIHGFTVAKPALLHTALTAGGGGDNAKITGLTIDRLQSGKLDPAKSVKLCVNTRAVLAQAATLSLAVEVQQSADGSTWDTAVVVEAATVKSTGGTGGSTESVVAEYGLNLLGFKRYLRFNVTPDLSAGATDTATVNAVAVLAGHDTIPQSAA